MPVRLLVLCLALCTVPAFCATGGFETVTDHARYRSWGPKRTTRFDLVLNVPPGWADDPGLAHAQLTVEAGQPVTMISSDYLPPAKPRPATLPLAHPPLFAAVVETADGAVPATLTVHLRLGDRQHTATLRTYPAYSARAKNPGPQPEAESFSYLSMSSVAPQTPRLPIAVYVSDRRRRRAISTHESDAYFRWDAPLPAGFDAKAGPLALQVTCGTVEGARVELSGTRAQVTGRAHTPNIYETPVVALQVLQGDHVVAQLRANLTRHEQVAQGGPALQEQWEQAQRGVSGAALTGAAPRVTTFRAQGSGYVWVQYPAPPIDASAYTAVARVTGAPLTLIASTVEPLAGRCVIHVVARFAGPGTAHLTTSLQRVIGGDEPPRPLPPVDLTLPAADGGDAAAREAWIFHMRKTLERKRYHAVSTAFFDYVDRTLERRTSTPATTTESEQPADAPRAQPDLLSAATGLLAVQEALQLDAMRGGDQDGHGTLELSRLTGPRIASHPFAKMMQGHVPRMFPMDACAPADVVYAHVSSFARALALLDDVESWGLDLAHIAEGRSVDSGVRERYTDALLLETGALTRMFGAQVVDDVGLVLADPFVREGTDVAVILHLANRALADAALAPRRLIAQAHGAVAATGDHRGTPTRSWTTADGTVSLHEADAGEFRVLATSAALLGRILDAQAGRAPALSREPDYQYMRTIFPGDQGQEDAFAYLSDAFVRRMVSPAFKLAARRRMLCAGQLTLVHNARLLARMEARDESLAALVAAGDLSAPRCPDGALLTVDGGVPRCPLHGRLDHLAPLEPERLVRVTGGEAAAYRAFVDGYNSYWRTYFDPVGVRLRAGGGTKLETVILPLVDSTIYTSLRETLQGDPAPLAFHGSTPTTVLALALRTPTKLFGELAALAYADELTPEERPESWLGRDVAVVVHDAAPLFTLDFSRGSALTNLALSGGRFENLVGLFMLSSFDLPLVVSAAVDHEDAAWRFLEKGVGRAMAAMDRPGGFVERHLDPYLVRDGVPAPVLVLPIDLWAIKLRYYVGVHAGRIWLSNQMGALTASMTAARPARTFQAHIAAGWLPGHGVAAAAERAQDTAEHLRHACLSNLTPAWVLLRLLGTTPERFAADARACLGFVPVCPEGGRYELEPATDAVQCSRHGSSEHPRQRLAPDAASPAARALGRLRELFVSLEFTPEGLATHLELNVDREAR